MTDLINQLRYLSRVTKDYDQEHMTSADYEMIPIVTKQAADRIEQTEAKLAKAMAGLRKIADHKHFSWDQGWLQKARIASAVLAELEGK